MDFAHPNDGWMGLCLKLWLSYFMCPTGWCHSYTVTGVVVIVCCCHRVYVVVMGSHHHKAAVLMVNVITHIVVIMGCYGDTHCRAVSL